MKNAVIFTALAVLALSNLSMWTAIYDRESGDSGEREEPEEPELAALMGDMQRYFHKLDLSVQAGSTELIGFYAHELEELSETIIEEVPTYESHEIAALTRQMLLPQIETLESAANADGDVVAGLKGLTAGCNGCHAATDHGYVRITPAETNPFNQDFSVAASTR